MSKTTNERLLEYLILKRDVDLNDIMLKFSLSKVKAINLINETNDLSEKDFINSNQQGIYMTEKAKMICYKRFFEGKTTLFDYHDAEDRYALVIIKSLINEEYSSLQELADICLVSRNTILNDMKVIKRILEEKGLAISYIRKKGGYVITGSEFNIRNILVSMVKQLLNLTAGKILLLEKQMISSEDIYLLRKRLEKAEKRIGITLTDEQLEDLPYILQFIINRAYSVQKEWTFYVQNYDIQNTLEYPEIKAMFWDFEKLNDTDLHYLSLQILSSNMVESAFRIFEGDEISLATDLFMRNIESYLAIQIAHKFDLKDKLILHMGPAIYRSVMGFQINNPLTEDFIEQYEDIYNVVLKSVGPYEEIIHGKLSREEVVYLSMIVLSWVYEVEETECLFKAVVLCQSGTSVSELLLSSLKQMFPEIDFIGAYAVRQFPRIQEEVDFIFTTIPIKSDTPIFLVPSVLDKGTRNTLRKQVYREIQGNNEIISEKLLELIQEFIPEEHMTQVARRIEGFFTRQQRQTPREETEQVPVHFIFSDENIEFVNEKVGWEQLVSFCMEAFLDRGTITQNYVNTTKEIFMEQHERMLIARNVYLPHASPADGVQEMDFQILIFKQPIVTPDGKDLKMIVALAPDEDNKHVPTLIKLNNLFNDMDVFTQIYHANNKKEILEILNSERGDNNEFWRAI